jgi:hypothetical protein
MIVSTKSLIGKRVAQVSLMEAGTVFKLSFDDGTRKSYAVAGDCCSVSWIEDLSYPDDVIGAELLSVEEFEVEGNENRPDTCRNCGQDHNGGRDPHDCVVVYKTVFRTSKGDITLEYRNDSNGYYGGFIVEVTEPKKK